MNKDHFVLIKHSNGYWYYWFYIDGKRIFRTTKEKTKKKALEVVLDRISKNNLLNKKHARKGEFTTFGEYAKPFWIWRKCPIVNDIIERGGKYTHKTIMQKRSRMERYILPRFSKMYLTDITPAIISEWLRGLLKIYNISAVTANSTFNILSQMLDFAITQNLLKINPAKSVKRLVEKPTQRGCFTVEEVKKLFSTEWTDVFSETACLLSATTGMRIGEIIALSTEQIKDNFITVDRSYGSVYDGLKSTKSGKTRIVPILPSIKEKLLSLPSKSKDFIFSHRDKKRPMKAERILLFLKEQMEKVGIDYKTENLTFHSFRHFFNTRLVSASVNVEHIRAVIGHESEEMTENYLHLTSSDFDTIRAVQEQILKA